jgi:hypothetical protein
VSAGFERLEGWFHEFDEPADWSLGFPTETAGLLLWATPEARALLPDPPNLQCPAATPELEDFLEAAMKAKRAVAAGDSVGARLYAHSLGSLAPGLIIPSNKSRRVSDRRDAVEAALSLSHAPEHYCDDLLVCLGLCSASDLDLQRAVARLPREMLSFLRIHNPDVDPQPWLGRYLLDGTLERHLLT